MPKQQAPLAVSLSAVAAYRQCQQLYYYRYVLRLRRKDRARAPELGVILHDYLEVYYQALKDGEEARDAHNIALLALSAKHVPEIRRYARQAHEAGQDDLAIELQELPRIASRIAERYFNVRGKADAERFDILLVEEWITLTLRRSLVTNGKVDLVTRDKKTGRVFLWEHKSTANVPDTNYRLRDLQTPLYAEKLADMGLCPPIDVVMWNYIRTKEPAAPELVFKGTKREQMTRRADLDSTWEVYYNALKAVLFDPADYEDQKQRLEGREFSVFFPRFEQVILAKTDLLFRDYTQSAIDIRRSRKAWELGARVPVRSLGLNCNWCEMAALCNAAILAGDDSDVRELRYSISS